MTTSDFEQLVTEARGCAASDLDALSTRELVDLLNREDETVPGAVGAAADRLTAAIEAIGERLRGGGRLVYVGAGTSGLLAALDAAECEATFGAGRDRVVAVVAGAGLDSPAARDAAEDDPSAGRADVDALDISAADAVVGVSASGVTPYVCGALRAARGAGALTVAVVANERSELATIADLEVAVVVGPEVVAGSTRLKAGTAQKLVLNAISTIAMVRLGKTFEGLMVDVRPANEKLRRRQRRIVATAACVDQARADEALAAAGGNAKIAIVSLLAGVDAGAAAARLEEAGGNVRLALGR